MHPRRPSAVTEHGLNAGGADPETRGRAIRRAWGQLVTDCEVELPLEVSAVSARSPRRRRLRPVPRVLSDWLYAEGYRLLVKNSWTAFLQDATRQPAPHAWLINELERIVATGLGHHGKLEEALHRVASQLSLADIPADRTARLLLVKAQLLLRYPRDVGSAPLAARILQDLQAALPAPSSVQDRLFLSRVHIAAAHAVLHGSPVHFDPQHPDALDPGDLLALQHAAAAEVFSSLHGPRELAELQHVRARLALPTDSSEPTQEQYETAERAYEDALALYDTMSDYPAVAQMLLGLAVTRVSRYRLQLWGPPEFDVSPERIAETLHMLEATSILFEIDPPYRTGVEEFVHLLATTCCIRLMQTHGGAGSQEIRSALAAKAREHLQAQDADEDWRRRQEDAIRWCEKGGRTMVVSMRPPSLGLLRQC